MFSKTILLVACIATTLASPLDTRQAPLFCQAGMRGCQPAGALPYARILHCNSPPYWEVGQVCGGTQCACSDNYNCWC